MEDKADARTLAIAQWAYKKFAGLVSTKDPDSLRSKADEEYRRLYEQTGAKSYDIKVAGDKVATYSLKVAKAKDEPRVIVEDEYMFLRWASESHLVGTVLKVDQRALDKWFSDSGELPDGCTVVNVHTPEHVTGGTLRVDERKMDELYAHGLIAAPVRTMIGGGE